MKKDKESYKCCVVKENATHYSIHYKDNKREDRRAVFLYKLGAYEIILELYVERTISLYEIVSLANEVRQLTDIPLRSYDRNISFRQNKIQRRDLMLRWGFVFKEFEALIALEETSVPQLVFQYYETGYLRGYFIGKEQHTFQIWQETFIDYDDACKILYILIQEGRIPSCDYFIQYRKIFEVMHTISLEMKN